MGFENKMALAGVLLFALAIPLILKVVPPNPVYGVRTSKTYSNQELWYAANRSAGITMAIAGVAILVGALVVPLFFTRLFGRCESTGHRDSRDFRRSYHGSKTAVASPSTVACPASSPANSAQRRRRPAASLTRVHPRVAFLADSSLHWIEHHHSLSASCATKAQPQR